MAGAARNPLIFIFITRLIDTMGFGIVMPVLPQLLLHMGSPDIASAARTAGVLLVVYSVLQFMCGPVIGNLSDRFGRRPVILLSLTAFGIDYLLMGFAPTITWLFVGRAIAGIAGAVYAPANAFIADVTPPERRAHAFGLVGAAFGVGFILGPAIGGLLGELGPRAPFFAAAALAGLNVLFGIFVLPESLPKERRRAFSWARANPLGAAVALYRYPAVLGMAFVTLLFMIGNNVYPSTWSFFAAAKFAWTPGMIGLSLAATGIGMAIVQGFFTGRIVKQFGERKTALIGLGVAITSYLLYAFMPAGWMVFPVAIVGAFQALTFPALNALMSRRVRADQQGELQGAVASIMSLSTIIAPFLMTQSFAIFTAPGGPVFFPGAPFIVATVLSVFGFLFLLLRAPAPVPDAPPTAPV